jgi:epoxide hydrolase
VSLMLAAVDHEHVGGAHVNFLITPPSGDQTELDGLGEADHVRLTQMAEFISERSGYMRIQATRPQTLSYALTDSPVGQLAWIVEKFREWTDSDEVPEDAVDRDLLLANAMIYLLTGTAGSSAQIYYESAPFLPTAPVAPSLPPLPVPLGVAVFPRDIILPIRCLAERSFPNIVHWSEFDRGGHFAAMEEPDLFVDDLRAFARTVPR